MVLDRIIGLPRFRLRLGKRRHVALADRARDAGQWQLAAKLYRQALYRNPRNAAIWVQYGHALKESGDLRDIDKLAQAEIAYRTALSLDPGSADTYVQLGHVLKLQGKTEGAHAAYLRAFVLDKSIPYPAQELGGLGWSEAHIAELQGMLANGSSPENCRPATELAWHGRFDADWYLKHNPDVARDGWNPLEHFLSYGMKEGRKPYATAPGSWSAVSDAEVRCLKKPSLRDEVALFVTHSPHGRLRPHVHHYLESLGRQGIAVVLIVQANGALTAADADLMKGVDGIFMRQAKGYDFAAWAHVLRLHPELTRAKILYLLNDSLFGPTNDAAFGDLLRRLRDSPADVIGLTENEERGWHYQTYFLALKSRALASPAFQRFVIDIVSFDDQEDVINQYEVRLAAALQGAGLKLALLFPVFGSGDHTIFAWRSLLESGFPFLKVKTVRDRWPGLDKTGWRELLAAKGYDVSLAERTLAEFAASTSVTAGSPCTKFPTDIRRWEKEIVLETPTTISLLRPLGIFVHVYYEDLADEIAGYLVRIDAPKRIYVSTTSDEKQRWIRAAFERHDLGQVTEIIAVPDYGFDFASFLIKFSRKFKYHDVCLKIHSKKSLNQPPEFGKGFRSHLFHELMGDSERVQSIINTMLAHPDVGVLIPQFYDYPGIGPGRGDIGPNHENMQLILAKIDINLLPDQEIYYPVGSMFWFRGTALAGLAGLGFDWLDFGCAIDQRDGTLAHAMERCVLFFSAKAGMKWGFLPPFEEPP
jgi:lipopolysaccharide biosynthesis protein